MSGPVELYRKYRPRKLNELIGQAAAVKTLTQLGKTGKIPHVLLFTGPSGCGKTTIARILARLLKCNKMDFAEINAADKRGVDDVRAIQRRMHLAPLSGGKVRIWLIDESHQLTTAAQDNFLKTLEETPDHVYFMLATTDPQKLKNTIRTRCTEIKVQSLNNADSEKLLTRVADAEEFTLDGEVIEKLVLVGEGSARKLLVLLHSIVGFTAEEQLEIINKNDPQRVPWDIFQVLMYKKNADFTEVAKILKDLTANDDAEGIRWAILTMAKNAALKQGNRQRAISIIDAFRDNFFDSKHAGLVSACYEVLG